MAGRGRGRQLVEPAWLTQQRVEQGQPPPAGYGQPPPPPPPTHGQAPLLPAALAANANDRRREPPQRRSRSRDRGRSRSRSRSPTYRRDRSPDRRRRSRSRSRSRSRDRSRDRRRDRQRDDRDYHRRRADSRERYGRSGSDWASSQQHRSSTAAVATSSGYRRDDDGSVPVDEALVEDLLIQRSRARTSRDYDRADSIKAQLKTMGIEVWDEERTWRAGQAWHKETAAAAAAAAARAQQGGTVNPATTAAANDLETLDWYYHDAHGQEQGPFSLASMRQWYKAGYFSAGAAGSAEAKKGADGDYVRISSILQITGGRPPDVAAAAVAGQGQAAAEVVEELDERARRMQGAAAQEAMRGRERFAGIGHTGVQEQEALLAQAKARQNEEAAAAASAAASAAAAAAAAKPASHVSAVRKKKAGCGGGGFLGSLKQQAKKTKQAQERHKHSDLDDVAKQGAAFTPVHYQR